MHTFGSISCCHADGLGSNAFDNLTWKLIFMQTFSDTPYGIKCFTTVLVQQLDTVTDVHILFIAMFGMLSLLMLFLLCAVYLSCLMSARILLS